MKPQCGTGLCLQPFQQAFNLISFVNDGYSHKSEHLFQVISKKAMEALKQDFMAAFDENGDDRIDIAEVRACNPTFRSHRSHDIFIFIFQVGADFTDGRNLFAVVP